MRDDDDDVLGKRSKGMGEEVGVGLEEVARREGLLGSEDSPVFFWMDNLLVIGPLILVCSLALGTLWYRLVDKWSLAVCFYFSSQVLLGVMYETPEEVSLSSEYFTLLFYLWGATLCAGAIGAFASHLVTNASAVAADERRRSRLIENTDVHAYVASANLYQTKAKLVALFAALAWYSLGVLYFFVHEKMTLMQALFFALGAMAAAGMPAPDEDENLDDGTAFALGIFIVIGVPLFSFAFGQFALGIVENAIRVNEIRILTRPLSEAEYALVRSLHEENDEFKERLEKRKREKALLKKKNSAATQQQPTTTTITTSASTTSFASSASSTISNSNRSSVMEESLDLSDFIVLELFRLQRFDEEDLEEIKALFEGIDPTRRSSKGGSRKKASFSAASASSSSSSSSDASSAASSNNDYGSTSESSSSPSSLVDVRNVELNNNYNNNSNNSNSNKDLPMRRTISFSRKIGGVGEGGGVRREEEEEKEGSMGGRYNEYILGRVLEKQIERRRVEAASPSFLSRAVHNRGSSFSEAPSTNRIGRDIHSDGEDSFLSRAEDSPLL